MLKKIKSATTPPPPPQIFFLPKQTFATALAPVPEKTISANRGLNPAKG